MSCFSEYEDFESHGATVGPVRKLFMTICLPFDYALGQIGAYQALRLEVERAEEEELERFGEGATRIRYGEPPTPAALVVGILTGTPLQVALGGGVPWWVLPLLAALLAALVRVLDARRATLPRYATRSGWGDDPSLELRSAFGYVLLPAWGGFTVGCVLGAILGLVAIGILVACGLAAFCWFAVTLVLSARNNPEYA
mmetsp:Transcript_4280/g.14826  ORF Transcript_4280/g.14826 Transcript_4280/m.14826 type:complete len:198 (-) Transcript_4280:58-651(-)